MATEVIRLKREQLERFIKDFETLQQFELLFETLDTINATTLVGLRTDVDANTVRSTTNSASILVLQSDKADILNPTFSDRITVTNNILVGGTVDGRDVAVDGAKLDTITPGAAPNTVDSVNGYAGVVVLVKSDVGLGAVDNTSDLDKPVSTAQQTALDLKLNVSNPAVTGNLTTDGLIDTRDVAVDGAKLDTITSGAEPNAVDSVNGYTGAVVLVKADVGLGNVDNTSDLSKPISTATQTALDGKKDDFTENTAFNKNFGTSGTEVCVGNDARLSDSRTCNNTFDNAATARTNLGVAAEFNRSTQVPTTGFSISVTDNDTDQWLVLNPAGALATGTVTFVTSTNARDTQRIRISSTAQITSLTLAGNGATIYGGVSVLAAESTITFQFDSSLTAWFKVD